MAEVDEVRLAVVTDPVDEGVGTAGASPGSSNGRLTGEHLRRLRSHLADPFSRNAYALMLNTGLTGLLGIGFWLLAARYYTDPDVGRGSALISTMTLLSGVVAINVTGTLSRFIPQTGRRTSRLVLYAYALSSVAVAALTAGFLLTLGYWGPSFDLLRDPATALWFVVAVIAAGVFTIQDGVLVGLRSSVWVPVENALFGIAKIVLLVLFATSFPRDGVYLSWIIPMALLVLPINGLIFGRLVPRHVRTTGDSFLPPSPAQMGRFLAADYVGALFVFGAVYLVPVAVAASVAPHIFAYFYVAWMMAGILNLIAVNLAHSLTVEGAYEAHKLAANCRAALRRALGLLLVAAVAVGLVAPYGLGVLGRGYLDAGPLLQVLAFAALPRAVVEIWIGVLRAQNRPREIARVQIASGSLVIGSVLVWLQLDVVALDLGVSQITGVGLAVLAGQTVVALAVLPRLRRFLAEAPPAGSAPGAVSVPAVTKPVRRAEAEPDLPEPVRRPTRTWAPVAGICVLTAVALVLYLLPLGDIDLDRMNGYGLISVLPVASLVGLALLTLTFVITLSFPRPRPVVLGAQLVVLVGCLHGVTALIESLPRFPITWVHSGFVEYIGRTGTTAPGLDGRFSWPGFFALVSFVTGEANWQDLVWLLKLTPLLSNLLFLLPLGLLLRNLRASWQAKWFAAWLFCVLNWVGQDYFSPQGFTYWLYLVFLAVLVTWFRPTEISTGELPPRPAEYSVRATLLLLLVGLFTVACFSHQLTPFFMLAACTGLVLTRRCVAMGLPVLLTVILAAWISYMTVTYWSGHLQEMFGGLGDLGGNISTSVADRASGNEEQQQLVVYARIALTVGLFALAAVGALRRRRRGLDDRLAVVLLLAPFITVALQSYGGEIALRVYLFALPAACVLAAYVFFPDARSGPRSPRRFMAAGACALVLMGGFFLTRYGNEQYEITRDGELAAVEYVYQHDGPARILFMADTPDSGATPFIPVGYQEVERVNYVSMQAPRDPDDVTEVISRLRDLGRGTYLMTTRSQEAYLELRGGYPAGWGDRFRTRLAAAPEVRMVKQTSDAVVYTLRGPQDAVPTQQLAAPTGTRIGNTPWTPVGVAFLAFLLVVLVQRELWRLRLPPDEHRRLRPLTFAAVPMLAGLALVVLERLVMLAV
ncbi:MAG: lipopolysaccharide biosynthesis protein [Pseudonocardiaceae bacterium]